MKQSLINQVKVAVARGIRCAQPRWDIWLAVWTPEDRRAVGMLPYSPTVNLNQIAANDWTVS